VDKQADFRRRWVEALRSGRYTKGTCSLRSAVNEYCVWGVACDLFDDTRWQIEEDDFVYHYILVPDLGCRAMPPADVMLAAGMTDTQIVDLMNLNDSGNTSFDDVAAEIERYDAMVNGVDAMEPLELVLA
jgi:hypothetical protein